MITDDISKVRADLDEARPEMMKEDAVFECPQCGAEIIFPMVAFIDFGAPNMHAECGWRGADLPMKRVHRNNV